MYDYVIIHGSYGSPFENWFQWLYNDLTSKGKKVLAPQFPCADNTQNLQNWSKVLNAYKPYIGKDTTFIAHSLGPAFVVDYILENDLHIKNMFFAAPFYGFIDNVEFDEVNKTFFIYKDFRRVKNLYNKAFCFISTTDPYVPNGMSKDFSEHIGAEEVIVQNAGHFNTAAGYSSFIQLSEMISNVEG